MLQTECPSRADLIAFKQGDLPDAADTVVEAHLQAGCPGCRQVLDELEREDESILGPLRDYRSPVLRRNTDVVFSVAEMLVSANGGSQRLLANKYELLAEIGKGGMGVVYRARDVLLDRVVAIKMICGSSAATTELRERFAQEARSLAGLQHPNIVRLYEYGEQDEQLYFAMEYVDGGTSLGQMLKEKPLDPVQVAQYGETLARAVQYAHDQRVIHRDLKPANMLLTRDGTLKIADFGIAKQLDADACRTGTAVVLGTVRYMSPEQASGEAKGVTFAADIYSLGVTLYEMLTGRPPFPGPSPLDVLDQLRNQEPAAPWLLQPTCPRDLETICLKCLEKDPKKRYARASDLADDLRRFLRGEPIHARPPNLIERARKWGRRHPLAAALVVVSVAALASTFGGLLYHAAVLDQKNETISQANARISEEERNTRTQRDAAFGAKIDVEKAKDLAERRLHEMATERHHNAIAVAQRFLQQRLLLDARQALEGVPQDRRGWEYFRLLQELDAGPRCSGVKPAHELGVLAGVLHGPLLAASGQDGTVVVWNTDTGALQELLKAIEAPSIKQHRHALAYPDEVEDAPVGVRPECVMSLCWLDDGQVLIGACFGGKKGRGKGVLWDLGKKAEPETIIQHDRPLLAVAASQDGKVLLFGDADGNLLHYDRAAKKLRQWKQAESALHVLQSLPSGHWIVGTESGQLQLLQADGTPIADSAVTVPKPVWSLAVGDEGKWLAVACGSPRLLTFRVDPVRLTLTPAERYEPPEMDLPGQRALQVVCIGPDERLYAVDEQGRLLVWRRSETKPLFVTQEQGPPIRDATDLTTRSLLLHRRCTFLGVNPKKPTTLFTGGRDSVLKQWSTGENDTVTMLSAGKGSQFRFDRLNPDLAWIGTTTGEVQLWNSRTGERLASRPAHAGPITSLDYAAEAHIVVTVGSDGILRRWKRDEQRHIVPHGDAIDAGQPLLHVSVSDDGQRLATYRVDNRVAFWDAAGKSLGKIEYGTSSPCSATSLGMCGGVIAGVAVRVPTAPGGRAVLNAVGDEAAIIGPGVLFHRVRLATLGAPVVLDGVQVAGLGGTAVVWHPTKPVVLVSSDSVGRLRLHPLPEGWFHPVGKDQPRPTAGVCVSPNGHRIAEVGLAGDVRLYDPAGIDGRHGNHLVTFPSPHAGAEASDIQFDPTGERLVVVYRDGTVAILESEAPDRIPIPQARRSWARTDLLPQGDARAADILVSPRNAVVLDPKGRVWLLLSRACENDPEAARLHVRATSLARETVQGELEEVFLADAEELPSSMALVRQGDDMIAALRRKSRPTEGETVLYRQRIDAPLIKDVRHPELFLTGPNNWGFHLHLFPGKSDKPRAVHFAYGGYYLCRTDWLAGAEHTAYLGRKRDGEGFRVCCSSTGEIHLFYAGTPQKPPYLPIHLTVSGDVPPKEKREEMPALFGAVPLGAALDENDRPALLYHTQGQRSGGWQLRFARETKEGWDVAAADATSLGRMVEFSDLVCDRRGVFSFAYLTPDSRRLCLATLSGKTWTSELVCDIAEQPLPTPSQPEQIVLALHLDGEGKPVIVATMIHAKQGWLRVFRPKE